MIIMAHVLGSGTPGTGGGLTGGGLEDGVRMMPPPPPPGMISGGMKKPLLEAAAGITAAGTAASGAIAAGIGAAAPASGGAAAAGVAAGTAVGNTRDWRFAGVACASATCLCLFDFRDDPKLFLVPGEISMSFDLEATQFVARLA